jgi:glycosyltransferase involved in cell wall biosynthesis
MRIGLLTGEYAPMQGGVGDFSRELSLALAQLGHEVHILTRVGCRPDGLIAGCTLAPEIQRWSWSVSSQISRWVGKHDLEIVNLQYQAAAFDMHPAVNLLSSRAVGVPMAVTFHDLKVPYLFPKAGPLRWWAVLALARRASGVIVTNREDQLALERHRLVPRPVVIPIGSNITPAPPPGYQRAAWRERWGVGADETLLGYFGFLNESKGGEDLIHMMDKLRERPIRLMMIGGRTGSSDPSNQAYADGIDALISRLGLGERIIWTGYTAPAEVSANLLATDICLLPYRDGVSFRRGSFMAALAHGLPIITTTPAVELPELRHRENIYLTPPAAPEALVAAVTALQRDNRLREELARGAHTLAGRFRWGSIADSTVELFGELIRRE